MNYRISFFKTYTKSIHLWQVIRKKGEKTQIKIRDVKGDTKDPKDIKGIIKNYCNSYMPPNCKIQNKRIDSWKHTIYLN